MSNLSRLWENFKVAPCRHNAENLRGYVVAEMTDGFLSQTIGQAILATLRKANY